ncbi:hypothetical protein [Pararhodospirillum photometricum]|uniref:hypothetical protein n=1 Tax=Pararhodospirillum photometricum TaxID=1084 RepID=UPI00059F5167|nr:hypothetical protein [Pararhodospirillum photometricum]
MEGSPLAVRRIGQTFRLNLDAPPEDTPALLHDGSGGVGLSVRGQYLQASPSGGVSWSPTRGAAARFVLIATAAFARLRHLHRHAWMEVRPRVWHPAGSLQLLPHDRVMFAGVSYTLAEVLICLAQQPERALSIQLRRDGWQVRQFEVFRPLIYFTAFGPPEMFQLLNIALCSLARRGAVPATYLVITRPEDRALIAEHGAEACALLGDRLRIACLDATSLRDFMFARYALATIPEGALYQPILYLDTDMVCDGPLENLFREAMDTDKILAPAEHLLHLDQFDWWGGKALFEKDSSSGLTINDFGMNSGSICAKNLFVLRESFELIPRLQRAHDTQASEPLTFDQPFFNYVVYKLGLQDPSVFLKHIRLNGHEQPPSPNDRRGLVHFMGGVGNSSPKLNRMRDYVTLLDALP